MEIADKNTERSTVIIAVLALVIIGVSLLVSTWQSVQRQQKAEQEHLYLTSRAVLLSIEHYLRRSPILESPTRLANRTIDFFESLETQGEIIFAGILDPETGGQVLTTPAHLDAEIDIPLLVLQELFQKGTWHGPMEINHRAVYVYAKKLDSQRPRIVQHFSEPKPPLFLMVGIDMEPHTKAHQGYRQAAIFQTGYILAAALLSWVLGTNFLARREQVRRAAILERFQATLIDNLPDGLLTLKPAEQNTIIEAANPAALDILQTTASSLLGQSIDTLPRELTSYITRAWVLDQPASWQKLSMQQQELEVLLLPLGGDDGSMLILRDRTQLRTLEKSLAEAEKLALVGTLAAGVAHEIRNPLSALRGFAQYFVKKLAGKKPEETYAKTMVHEADRLNRVITDLLFLGRPKDLSPETIDLAALVGELCGLLRFDLEQKHLCIGQDLQAPVVYADREALKQAMLNLVLNSIDATENFADESVNACNAPLIAVASYQDAQNVVIEVQDQGCGMTKEQAQKAFDPFFTGKGAGTGLGLCLVRSTMLEHKGAVEIISAKGQGCTIRLLFPRHEDAV